MGTLTITKTYLAGDPFFEVDIDAYRTGLHTLFNTDLFSSLNFSGATALVPGKFSGVNILPTDNTDINFGTDNDAFFGINSSKQLFWNTALTTTEIRFYAGTTYYLEFASTGVNVPGDIVIGEGGSGKTILQALGSYKKPVIEYNSSTSIKIQQNSSTTDNTVIYFPNFVASVTEAAPTKYRYSAISATANGYGAADSGAALGGRKAALALTTNSWYYVYAAKLRSGTDYSATTAKFIMVFDDTAPSAESTLNTTYGAGNWLFLGLVRYGFGATGTTNEIIPFKYSNKGWCSFYAKSSSGYGGLNLTYTTTDADNTASALYTIAAGSAGNVIPAIIGHIRLSLNRERASDWYIKDTSGDVVWQGGWQDDDGTMSHGHLIELVNDTGYGIYQLRKSSLDGTAKGVCLAGFCDSYMVSRRLGHGI